MNRRNAVSVSAVAIAISLIGAEAQAQFTALPTINVGGQRPAASTAARPSRPSGQATRGPVRPAPAIQDPTVSVEQKPPPLTASSDKFYTGAEVTAYPYSRPSESLEIVPGLIVSQHSGEGKANQYFLRGFNLDHGTDLALYLDGMPLNMRTHGHGQGYADTNFLMPELLSSILVHKGPYAAEDGDFSSAGSIYIQYIDKIDKGYFSGTGGSFGYGRGFAIQPYKDIYGGDAYGAVEMNVYNGPWERGDEVKKINGVLRWTRGTQSDGMSLTAMAYANRWYSTDQIPMRAVNSGLLSLWGTTDPTDGGNTTRFSLSGRWSQTEGNHYSRVEAYAIRSTLELYNNFTYYLAHPDVGDQFRQFDRRTIVGVNAQHGIAWNSFGLPVQTRFGLQGRYDDIRLGLQESFRRNIYDSIRNDYVGEGSIGIWTDTTVSWTPWLRTVAGARVDLYSAATNSIQTLADAPKVLNSEGTPIFLWTGPFNNGQKDASIFSPKASIILGPWYATEMFLNFGEGFHSTDARGTVQSFASAEIGGIEGLDLDSFSVVGRIPLLVKSRGAEIGWRTKFIEGLDSSVSLFWLNLDSENQYVGDAGTTEFGRPSRRYGIEIANHYHPVSWISFDGNVAIVNTRFRGVDQNAWLSYAELTTAETLPYGTFLGNAPGNYLFNAPAIVAMGGLEIGEATGWFAGMKYRYFGARPLTPDGYFTSPATGTFNARLGYRWADGWRIQFDAFNIFNSRSDQITYAYGSLLPSDALYQQCVNGLAPGAVCGVGVMDRHFKPVEPPAVRLTFGGPISFDSLPDFTAPLRVVPD
ncbi:TonB-dependent receptor [Methylocystis sp.]|uniref:TonB-dependent receptor n=1 Tax=Methylocystis sp. TaxID=1911079 RepID=UPI0027327C9D|nr:TonB-dependent receptor [Methylocystis sp.]MDP3553002.1 TonB-dependent receptor [Methylocystis sp.]